MPLRVLYQSDFYLVELDPVHHIIRSTWLRPVNYDEMVTGGKQLYHALLQTKVKCVVANAQKLTNLTPETKEWMAKEFYELLSKTDLKQIARVLPSNVFAKLALESVVTRAEAADVTRFEVKNFTDQEQAEQWLLGQETV